MSQRGNLGLACTVGEESDVLGYLVVDSFVAGRSCGGVRMLGDIDMGEIRALAQAMTLKYGFLGLPQGGAKAGVLGDPEAPRAERLERLARFGRAIAPLLRSRAFAPCADMGTTGTDIRHMLGSVGLRVPRRELLHNSSGYYTAVSVHAGAVQAARHLGLDLSQCTAAIEGFGSVGRPLARLLARAGTKVVAVSTSRGAIYNARGLETNRLAQLADEVGSRVVEVYRDAQTIDRRELPALPVDLLCPCARHDSLRADNAPRVSARIVCGGANNPVTAEAERLLSDRSVLCLPDFLTNCGGVLGGTMEFASIGPERIAAFIDRHLGPSIAAILDEADRRRVVPRIVAEAIARRRFDRVQQHAAHPGVTGRLLRAGLRLYRRGLVPSRLVGALAPGYFERLPFCARPEESPEDG